MEVKNMDSMNVMDNKIFLTSEKPLKVVFEGEPISREEALKLWFEILQKVQAINK